MGLVTSAMYSMLCLGRQSGSQPAFALTIPGILYRGMFFIAIDDNEAFHLHHWMLLLPFTFLPLPPAMHWFIIGMVIQGLCYSDRFEYFAPNPYTAQQEDELLFVEDWV